VKGKKWGNDVDSRFRGNDPDEIAEAASHGVNNEIATAYGLAMTLKLGN